MQALVYASTAVRHCKETLRGDRKGGGRTGAADNAGIRLRARPATYASNGFLVNPFGGNTCSGT